MICKLYNFMMCNNEEVQGILILVELRGSLFINIFWNVGLFGMMKNFDSDTRIQKNIVLEAEYYLISIH